MRIAAPLLTLAAVWLAGCHTCPPPEIIGPSWDTPEKAFRTFRAAVIGKRPDLIYESFSPGFKKDYEVPGYREFKAGYYARDAEFDQIASVFEEARIDVDGVGPLQVDPDTGIRWTRVRIRAGDMMGSFILVELPTAHIVVEIPGYDPEVADYYVPGPGFGGHVAVKDGYVHAAVDAAEAGVTSPDEIREIRFFRQWLLRDIQDLPVNVRAIIDSTRRSKLRP